MTAPDRITLFGCERSGSAAIEMALARCGLDYDRVETASWSPGPDLERLRALNPLVQIPTLHLPDGSVMTESAAILIHLGLQHQRSGLLPGPGAARVQAIRGLVYIAANCYPDVGITDYPERWLATPDDPALVENLRAGARAHLHAAWEHFADQFVATRTLDGRSPGALDFLAVVVSRFSGARDHLRAARPGFAAVLDRIERDPTVAAVVARHWKS